MRDRRRRRLREARQLHRQRPEGHGGRRPPPRPSASATTVVERRRRRARARDRVPRRLGRLAVAGMTSPSADAPTAGRRPARRPVGRARRVDRVGHGHRRGARRRAGTTSRQVLIDLDGALVVAAAPTIAATAGRPRRTTTRPRSAPTGPLTVGAALDRLARRRPGAGRLHRAPRPVRRGRHGPGAARGGRPRLHRRGRRGLGARHGQGALQAALPRDRPAGRRLARGPRRPLGGRSRRASSPSSRRSPRAPATRG